MSSPINVSYVSPQAIITVGAFFPALSVLLVGLRFFIRRFQKARLLADDWLLVPALVAPPLSCQRTVREGAVAHGLTGSYNRHGNRLNRW